MRGLARDARGLPIPATVWRDKAGRPHFTINDFTIAGRLLIEDRCGICGTALLRVRWFVGGPLSAFHPHGAYYDLPMHRGCMHYALRVCPYLAAPVYSKRVDAKTVQGPEKERLFIDPTMIENRPTVFVAVAATGQQVRSSPRPAAPASIIPNRPYVAVEYWRHGKQLSEREAELHDRQSPTSSVSSR
jgi:hypothetical protein